MRAYRVALFVVSFLLGCVAFELYRHKTANPTHGVPIYQNGCYLWKDGYRQCKQTERSA